MTYTLRDEVTDIVSKYYHDDLSRESSVDRILALFAEDRAALEANVRSHGYKRDIALERAEKAESRVAKLREALEEARDFIDNYQDTIDGEYGRPHPNKAMVIVQHIDAALATQDAAKEGSRE